MIALFLPFIYDHNLQLLTFDRCFHVSVLSHVINGDICIHLFHHYIISSHSKSVKNVLIK